MKRIRKQQQTKLDERQFMDMAVAMAAGEVPIVKGTIEEARTYLYNCDYDCFISHAEQVLVWKPKSAQVAFCIEQALAKFPRRNTAAA